MKVLITILSLALVISISVLFFYKTRSHDVQIIDQPTQLFNDRVDSLHVRDSIQNQYIGVLKYQEDSIRSNSIKIDGVGVGNMIDYLKGLNNE